MEDDTACWQCGHPVAGKEAAPEARPAAKEKWMDAVAAGRSTPLLFFYGGLTVVVVLLALALTVYLGNQPLVQAARQRAPDGWSYVSNRSRTFTLLLPDEWLLFDVEDSELADDEFGRLVAEVPALTEALRPLGRIAEDTQLIFVAMDEGVGAGETPGNFAVVGRSTRLRGLAPEDAVALVGGSDVAVRSQEIVTNFDKSHVYFDLIIPAGGGALECRQQFVSGRAYSLILSACGRNANLLPGIVDSFQYLER